MLKQDLENLVGVQGTTAELQSGVSNIEEKLRSGLMELYDIVGDLYQEFPIYAEDTTDIRCHPIYRAHGLVFDFITELGYEPSLVAHMKKRELNNEPT